jgi:hypothetical protein
MIISDEMPIRKLCQRERQDSIGSRKKESVFAFFERRKHICFSKA